MPDEVSDVDKALDQPLNEQRFHTYTQPKLPFWGYIIVISCSVIVMATLSVPNSQLIINFTTKVGIVSVRCKVCLG